MCIRDSPYRAADDAAIRREPRAGDAGSIWRPSYVRDAEKIMHLPAYSRLNGKTQVFSFRSNDDLSRRGLHVQLVARIARDIGRALGLNCDLIEAIGLGHDLGHTPFGHAGEARLNDITTARTGRSFFHNVHSVRVLDKLYGRNLSLQTLDGVLCHNGEYEQRVFELSGMESFEQFDHVVGECYTHDFDYVKTLRPMTLEACLLYTSGTQSPIERAQSSRWPRRGMICSPASVRPSERSCSSSKAAARSQGSSSLQLTTSPVTGCTNETLHECRN